MAAVDGETAQFVIL